MSLPLPNGGGLRPPFPDLTPRSRARHSGNRVLGLLLLGALLATGAGTAMLATGGAPAAPSGSPLATLSAAALLPPSPGTGSASPQAGTTPSPSSPETVPPTATLTPSPGPKEPPPTSVPPEALTGYVWPLRDARLGGRFRPRPASEGGFIVVDGKAFHDGQDMATYCGDKIRAAHDGTVLYAGRRFDDYLGYLGDASRIYERLERQGRLNQLAIVIVIDDGNGYRSVYVHLSKADVEAGQQVRAGEVIGLEGTTGFSSGCHLHYGLIRMDGPWQVVVPSLHPFGYPPLVRERVDPLRVLPRDSPDAPVELSDASPSPDLSPLPSSPSPSSPQPAAPSPSATIAPSP